MSGDYIEGVRDAISRLASRRACYPKTSEVYQVLTKTINDLIQIKDSQK